MNIKFPVSPEFSIFASMSERKFVLENFEKKIIALKGIKNSEVDLRQAMTLLNRFSNF